MTVLGLLVGMEECSGGELPCFFNVKRVSNASPRLKYTRPGATLTRYTRNRDARRRDRDRHKPAHAGGWRDAGSVQGWRVAVTTISIQTGGSGMPKLEAERLSFFWTGLDALLVKKSSCSRSF